VNFRSAPLPSQHYSPPSMTRQATWAPEQSPRCGAAAGSERRARSESPPFRRCPDRRTPHGRERNFELDRGSNRPPSRSYRRVSPDSWDEDDESPSPRRRHNASNRGHDESPPLQWKYSSKNRMRNESPPPQWRHSAPRGYGRRDKRYGDNNSVRSETDDDEEDEDEEDSYCEEGRRPEISSHSRHNKSVRSETMGVWPRRYEKDDEEDEESEEDDDDEEDEDEEDSYWEEGRMPAISSQPRHYREPTGHLGGEEQPSNVAWISPGGEFPSHPSVGILSPMTALTMESPRRGNSAAMNAGAGLLSPLTAMSGMRSPGEASAPPMFMLQD